MTIILPYPDNKEGFVYVLAMVTPSVPVFKIGKAVDVDARLNVIQPLLPWPSFLIFALWCEDPLAQERYLHRYLAEYRLAGEWFELPDESLEQFHELAKNMRAKTPEWAKKDLCAIPLEEWRKRNEQARRELARKRLAAGRNAA